MNILAEEQLKILEANISEEERSKRSKSFYQLYFKLRRKEENSYLGRLSLKARKRLHPLALLVCIIKNHLGGFSHEVIKDERTKTDRPIIFAITHVGKFDIEVVSEAIKDHYSVKIIFSFCKSNNAPTCGAPQAACNHPMNDNLQICPFIF